MRRIKTWAAGSSIRIALLAVVALFLVIQLVPSGHDHSNPPITRQANFGSPQAERLVSDACGACHSNLTSWPIESNVAPFSWLIQSDVEGGREVLNFSEWDRAQVDVGEIADVVHRADMPPLQYRLLHPSARLSDTEKQDLIDGVTAPTSRTRPDRKGR
jgi:hypothetical protein